MSSERISANLKLIDSKKTSLRKAILLLALEWKDLDEHMESTEQCFEECLRELELKEKNLDSIRGSVIESNKELDLIRKSIESRLEELESKEKKFQSFLQVQIEDLKSKEKQLNTIRMSAEERIKEVELREEMLCMKQKSVEGLLQKLEVEKKQFEPIQISISEQLKEMSLKEKYFEDRSKELDSIQNWIERRVKELDTKEERVEERSRELELKVEQVESIRKLNDERCKELELKEKELDSAKKLNDEWAEKLDSKEKQLNSVQKYINQCFKDFHSKNKQLKLDKKVFEERSEELELKEKQLEVRSKELELKEKQFDSVLHSRVKVEQVEDMPADNVGDCLSADIQFVVTMDGRSLQFFLNERSKDHELMSSEVYRALQLSLDPAKLVLDAMEGFYPPHLKKGDVEFEEGVVRRSCILLLEQLLIISPQIQPHVKEEALKLAGEWKVKMRVVPGNHLEVLGFIQLLASYKMASPFDTGELLKLFEVVAEHKQAPQLCQVLGLTEKVPDLIENFIKKKQYLVAFRFSFAFELVDEFPPVPLLTNYLKRSKKVAKIICCKGNNSLEAQDRAIDERVASMRTAIKCIVDHQLESKFSCKNLQQWIEQLLIQKEGNKQPKPAYNKQTKPSYLTKTPAREYSDNKLLSSTTAPVQRKASAPTLDPTVACILANMDGKNLQLFLNKHLEEHELMRKEVSDALQMSFDSGKLVLDAMQGFYPPHSKKGGIDIEASVIRRSCIFLLELLIRLSPQIKPQAKEAAMKLAVDWKANIVVDTKNPLVILGFLLLVGTYGLASAFDADELLNLFQTVAKHSHAPELFQALGFLEKFPVSNVLHSQEKINQSTSENLQLNDTVPPSSVGPWWGELPDPIQFASDPAKLVLDAMQGCCHSNLEGEKSSKLDVMKIFIPLLRQLLRVPVEVKSHVKEEAMKFAADWKAEVVEKSRNPSGVWLFLWILAAYKLASSCNTNELLDLLEIVYMRRQAIDLFHSLGLADEVPNFIRRLIERKLHLEAIGYIYTFNLVDKFPPVSFLKGHLSNAEEAAKKICEEGHNSLQAQDKATKKQIAALKAVIKCIGCHGLESEYAPENLEARIEQLVRQQADRRLIVPTPASKAQPHDEVDRRSAMQSPASKAQPQEETHQGAAVPSPASKAQPQEETHQRAAVPSPASKAQPQEETLQRAAVPSPSLKAQPQEETCLRAAVPSPSLKAQPQEETCLRAALPSPASKAQPQKKVDRRSAMQSPASKAQPQEETHQRAAMPFPALKAQPQKKVDRRSAMQSPASKAQPQEETHQRAAVPSPASKSRKQKPKRKKRYAPVPDLASNTQSQHRHAKKLCRRAISAGAAPNTHVGSAHPIQSMQLPYQHPPAMFEAETAPYLRTHSGHYCLGGSTPVPLHTSHLVSQHGSGAPANGNFLPFGLAGTHFGSVPNFNATPFSVAGKPYYSWSVPGQPGLNDFRMH